MDGRSSQQSWRRDAVVGRYALERVGGRSPILSLYVRRRAGPVTTAPATP